MISSSGPVPDMVDDDTVRQLLELQKERSGNIYQFASDIRQQEDQNVAGDAKAGFMPVLAFTTDANVSAHMPSLSPAIQSPFIHNRRESVDGNENSDDHASNDEDDESEVEDIDKLASDNAERIRKEREEIMCIVQKIQHTEVDVSELMDSESFMNNSASNNVDKVTIQQALDDVRKQKTEIERIEDATDKQELLQAQIQFRLDRMAAERAAVQHKIRVKQDRICQLYEDIALCNKAVEVWLPRDVTNQKVRSQNLEDQYSTCLEKQTDRQYNLRIYLEHLQNTDIVKVKNELHQKKTGRDHAVKQIAEEEKSISICGLVQEQLQLKHWELKKRETGINNYNATILQAWWRKKAQQKRFRYTVKSVIRIQRSWRRYKERELARRLEAAVKIQSVYRGHRARKMLGELRKIMCGRDEDDDDDIDSDDDILDFAKDKDGEVQLETDDEVHELISNMQDMKLHKIVTPVAKVQKDWGFKNELTALWALRKQQRFEHISNGAKRKQMLKDPMTRLDAFYRVNNKTKPQNVLPPLPNSVTNLIPASEAATKPNEPTVSLQETYKKMSDFKLPFLQPHEEIHNEKLGSFPGDKPPSAQ